MPQPTDGGKTYASKIRDSVKFQAFDGGCMLGLATSAAASGDPSCADCGPSPEHRLAPAHAAGCYGWQVEILAGMRCQLG
jgi:hypothetical protein